MSINVQAIYNRVARAKEAMEEAILMKVNGHHLTTLNRLYYSIFYAASAALLSINIIAKTHSGTKTQFQNAFIKTYLLPQSVSDLYNEVFENRQSGDYDDFFTITDEKVDSLVIKTQQALTTILNFIPTIDQ